MSANVGSQTLESIMELILALPVKARKRMVESWKDYLDVVDDPDHQAEVAAAGQKLVDAASRGELLQTPLIDAGPSPFDTATIKALVAIDEAIQAFPRDDQIFLIGLAHFRDEELSEENRADLIRLALNVRLLVRSFPH